MLPCTLHRKVAQVGRLSDGSWVLVLGANASIWWRRRTTRAPWHDDCAGLPHGYSDVAGTQYILLWANLFWTPKYHAERRIGSCDRSSSFSLSNLVNARNLLQLVLRTQSSLTPPNTKLSAEAEGKGVRRCWGVWSSAERGWLLKRRVLCARYVPLLPDSWRLLPYNGCTLYRTESAQLWGE